MERMDIGFMQTIYNVIVFFCFVWILHMYLTPRFQRKSLTITIFSILFLITTFNLFLNEASVLVRNLVFTSCILIPIYLAYEDSFIWMMVVMLLSFSFMIFPEVLFDFYCYFILRITTEVILHTYWYAWLILCLISLVPPLILMKMKTTILKYRDKFNHHKLYIIVAAIITNILLPSLCILSLSSNWILFLYVPFLLLGNIFLFYHVYSYFQEQNYQKKCEAERKCYRALLSNYDSYTQQSMAKLLHECINHLQTMQILREKGKGGSL